MLIKQILNKRPNVRLLGALYKVKKLLIYKQLRNNQSLIYLFIVEILNL